MTSNDGVPEREEESAVNESLDNKRLRFDERRAHGCGYSTMPRVLVENWKADQLQPIARERDRTFLRIYAI